MIISTFEIKIWGQKLCAQKDWFRISGHISTYSYALVAISFTSALYIHIPNSIQYYLKLPTVFQYNLEVLTIHM